MIRLCKLCCANFARQSPHFLHYWPHLSLPLFIICHSCQFWLWNHLANQVLLNVCQSSSLLRLMFLKHLGPQRTILILRCKSFALLFVDHTAIISFMDQSFLSFLCQCLMHHLINQLNMFVVPSWKLTIINHHGICHSLIILILP